MLLRSACVVLVLVLSAQARAEDRTYVNVEVDPLPFANGGYGVQLGIRHPALHGVRIAAASFSLHVPDFVTELGGNEGFDLKVRPSAALYVLYYLEPGRHDGFAIGGSVRYLRLRYRHDEVAGDEAMVGELSPEAIVAYQWHPFDNGFYVQPWIALGVTLWRNGEAIVGDRRYDAMPVIPFFTVNVGWEQGL